MNYANSISKVCAVETRAQKLRNESTSPLQVPKCIREFSKLEVIEGQSQDKSIERYVTAAVTSEKTISKGGSVSWFSKENGIVYRKY